MCHQPVPLAGGQIHYRLNLLLLTRNQPETGIYTCTYNTIHVVACTVVTRVTICAIISSTVKQSGLTNQPINLTSFITRFPSMCVQVMTFEPPQHIFTWVQRSSLTIMHAEGPGDKSTVYYRGSKVIPRRQQYLSLLELENTL